MNTIITLLFIVGYAAIAFEHSLKINKTASALLTGVLCWVVYIMASGNTDLVSEQLYEHFGQISGILFFLLAAMTIVELIDAHDGFKVITDKITTKDTRKLLWIISFVTFFLSSVLDNLTTTIVMVSLLRKLITDKEIRMFFIGMVVIAANAGGAWTPIGDVTTTMLWIGGQITTGNIMIELFVPSLLCIVVPLILLSFRIKGKIENAPIIENQQIDPTSSFERKLILGLGIGALIFVPVFKTVTGLPPFLGILFGLGVLWVVTEIIHKKKNNADKDVYSVVHALRKVDVPSVLFFLGILVAISALESTHLLANLAAYMDRTIGNINVIVISIGLLSAIIDNVPLVAATMGMYDMQTYPTDHYFWEFIAYCAGTGGSCLIIGSAAGVAAMGMEKIDFFWYVKKISLLALLGYFAGAFAYIAQHALFH
ncbi:MAG TPA: sodium:proton antiporter NhaD [Chitinophagaceae bacterium]|nr:sodium:proton antiporter NhaD [Chitinophagaceae bacterium]